MSQASRAINGNALNSHDAETGTSCCAVPPMSARAAASATRLCRRHVSHDGLLGVLNSVHPSIATNTPNAPT